jgi:uroporphyrinogen decarboxylase
MNTRERFANSLLFQPVDRPFHWETLGMWPETLDRWFAEGLDPGLAQPRPEDWGALRSDMYLRVLVRGFGLDRVDYLRGAVISGYTESPFLPEFDLLELENDGEKRLIQDHDGILKREFVRYGTSSMPQYVRYPVKTRADFHALLPRLDPSHPQRLCADWAQTCTAYARRDFPVGLTICGAYGHPRNLLGVEGLSEAYYDQPALLREILEHWTDFYCRLAERVWQGVQFDFVLIWEDMAYKNGPLISPRMVREFMLPYYRRFIEHVRGLGCRIIIVDSDGDVRLLAPLFLSAGVNAMLPFEVQAGMDVREFRRQYGRDLALIGGLDKRCLAESPAAVEDELRGRMLPLLRSGGYIPALDHTVPPNVSLDQFHAYLDLIRRIGEEAYAA